MQDLNYHRRESIIHLQSLNRAHNHSGKQKTGHETKLIYTSCTSIHPCIVPLCQFLTGLRVFICDKDCATWKKVTLIACPYKLIIWCSRHNLSFLQGWTSFNISVTEASKAFLSALMSFKMCRYFIACSTFNCQVLVSGTFSGNSRALFQSAELSKHFTTLVTFTHTHVHTLMAGCQPLIRSNLGFGILLKDTSTCSWREPASRTLEDPLCLTSYIKRLSSGSSHLFCCL